jgi:hypothetical protein
MPIITHLDLGGAEGVTMQPAAGLAKGSAPHTMLAARLQHHRPPAGVPA